MNSRRALIAQSVRGPILLMTVGVIFAMHQAGFLQFWRTWPLILIVIGVMKLIERLGVPQPPPFGGNVPPAYSSANVPPSYSSANVPPGGQRP